MMDRPWTVLLVSLVGSLRADDPIISGQGAYRYQYMPDKLQFAGMVDNMQNAHGLTKDSAGYIYFTYQPFANFTNATQALVRFDPDGTNGVLLGDPALSQGVPHGLRVGKDLDGTEFLLHANNANMVHKTTLDGKIIWTEVGPPVSSYGVYRPTQAISPRPGQIFVTDGYGSSKVTTRNSSDGSYTGLTFGGSGTNHGQLSCPHGITYDNRTDQLLICDRSNKRLEWYTFDGKYVSTMAAPVAAPKWEPCNVDITGDLALVPCLDGPVVILNGTNDVISVVEMGALLGDKGFLHPHDAIWLGNGDIIVGTWNPGRLAYWKRLPVE